MKKIAADRNYRMLKKRAQRNYNVGSGELPHLLQEMDEDIQSNKRNLAKLREDMIGRDSDGNFYEGDDDEDSGRQQDDALDASSVNN